MTAASTALAELAATLPPGAILTDAETLGPALTDWRGRIHGTADALLRPRTTADVVAIVGVAARHGIALVPQGGNTGLVGGGIAHADAARPAFLLSLRAMNAVRSIDAEGLSATVEAGVVLEALESRLADDGLRFPLSLASKGSATIGGLVSTNAGGVQVLRHGTMRNLVLGIEAVMGDGYVLDQLQPLRKDNTGYDVKQLLIGAEGTLGVVTAVSLRLAPKLAVATVGWAAVSSVDAALALLAALRIRLGERVESFELIGRAAFDLALERVPGLRRPIGSDMPFHVLMDVEAPEADVRDTLAAMLEAGVVVDATIAASVAQAGALWRIRESVPEAERLEGAAVKNDVAVPVRAVPEFLADVEAAVQQGFPGARPLVFGHLGDGNLHLNIRPPLGDASWMERHEEDVRTLVHDRVHAHGGTISAEHGIGSIKAAELARLGDPGKLRAMRALKAALDPAGIFNPGKILSDASHRLQDSSPPR